MDAESSIRVSQNQVFGGMGIACLLANLLYTARLHLGWEALLFFSKDRDGDRECFFRFVYWVLIELE